MTQKLKSDKKIGLDCNTIPYYILNYDQPTPASRTRKKIRFICKI